jgi:RNA polymerase sigma-70 factor, ECF subfamily
MVQTQETTNLVIAAQAGDTEAFSCLVHEHQRMVFGICYRLTGNVHDAQDLAHDALVEAFLKLGMLRDPARFGAWLKTTTLNLARSWYRQRKQFEHSSLEDTDAIAMTTEDDSATEVARLFKGVGHLPTAYRLPVVLYYLEELSCEEVGAFLGLPAGTVMSRLHRARQILREEMDHPHQEEEIPMSGNPQFEEEIDAEIALLLEAFEGDREGADRLSGVLVHSPERLARLISAPSSAATLTNLARLLPRLGRPGIRIVVRTWLEGSEPSRQSALHVLQSLVGRYQDNRLNVGAPPMVDTTAYLVVDELLSQSKAHPRSAELLIVLMQATPQRATGMMFGEVVLGFGEAGYALLLGHVRQTANPQDLYPLSNHLFQTLRHTGTRFLRQINQGLREGASPDLWLSALDVFAVGISNYGQREGRPAVPGARFVAETSDPAILALVQLQQSDLDEAADLAARHLTSPSAEVRRTAIRVLERLHAGSFATQVSACLADADANVRIAAIHALAAMGSRESASVIADLVNSPDAALRRAALQAIGRLAPDGAAEVLRTRLTDPDSQVRSAATVAMGELRWPEVQQELRELLRSSDPVIRKAAAIALYGMDRKASAPKPTHARPHAPRYSTTTFSVPHAVRARFVSLDAALRSLPELRIYSEQELTQYIAQVCSDWSATRRGLVDLKLLDREDGRYRFTYLGEAAWRVERWIMDQVAKQQSRIYA